MLIIEDKGLEVKTKFFLSFVAKQADRELDFTKPERFSKF